MVGRYTPTMLLNNFKKKSMINTKKVENNHVESDIILENTAINQLPANNPLVVMDWHLTRTSNGVVTAVSNVLEFIRTESNLNDIKEKHELPVAYFSASGFEGGKKDHYVTKHSGLIIVDIDTKENPDTDFALLKIQLSADPNTFACFTSPRGGLKAIYNTNIEDLTHHKAYYEAIKQHLLTNYPQIKEIDTSGSNPARACYLPHDGEVYFNSSADRFELSIDEIEDFLKKHPYKKSVNNIDLSIEDLELITLDEHTDNLINLIMRKEVVIDGNEELNENRKEVVIVDSDINTQNRKRVEIVDSNGSLKNRKRVGIYANIFNSYRYTLFNIKDNRVMSSYFRFLELLILKHSYPYRLDFTTRIDERYFADKPEKVISNFEIDGFEGLKICEVVLPKNGIKEGSRGKTIATITMKLIYNNPFCHPHNLFKAVKWINDSYCEDPSPQNPKPDDKEVFKIVMYNYQRFLNGELDFSSVEKRNGENEVIYKHVFRSKQSTTRGKKQKQLEGIRVYHTGRNNMMEQKYLKAINDLQDGFKITQKRIGEYMGVGERTVRNYQTSETKALIKKYNETLKKIDVDKTKSVPEDNIEASIDSKTPSPNKQANPDQNPESDIDFSVIDLEDCDSTQPVEEPNEVGLDEVFEKIFGDFIKRNAGTDVPRLRVLFNEEINGLCEEEKQFLVMSDEKNLDYSLFHRKWEVEDKVKFKVLKDVAVQIDIEENTRKMAGE